MDFMLEVSKIYGSTHSTHITSNIHRAHPFFQKSVDWNITKSWSTCNAWDLDILGGEGLPRSQEIMRSHQDSNLSISSHVWPCPGHSPTSCRAHKAHRCMMYMALVVVAVTMGFAVCTRKLQAVGCCFFGIHTVHHTKRKARHPHWDHEEHNQYDHPRDLLLQPYPKVSVFTRKATHPQISEGLAQTHQLMLDGTSAHSPASCASHVNATRGTSVLLWIAARPYLHVSNSGKSGED